MLTFNLSRSYLDQDIEARMDSSNLDPRTRERHQSGRWLRGSTLAESLSMIHPLSAHPFLIDLHEMKIYNSLLAVLLLVFVIGLAFTINRKFKIRRKVSQNKTSPKQKDFALDSEELNALEKERGKIA